MQENPNQKRVARWMNLLCGSLFTIFSFSYLYFLQAELIGRAQHILSGGTTTYAPFMGAAVLTCVALLLSAGIQKLLKLPVRFYCFGIFPVYGTVGVVDRYNARYDGERFESGTVQLLGVPDHAGCLGGACFCHQAVSGYQIPIYSFYFSILAKLSDIVRIVFVYKSVG